MILRWLRTIVLAIVGLILLFVYTTLYQNVLILMRGPIMGTDFAPLIVLLVEGVPFLAGLCLGLAAFNGPIRGVKVSVLNFLAIAAIPMLFGCGLPTLMALGRIVRPLGQVVFAIQLGLRSVLGPLDALLPLVAGIGLGLTFVRGFTETEPEIAEAAAPLPGES